MGQVCKHKTFNPLVLCQQYEFIDKEYTVVTVPACEVKDLHLFFGKPIPVNEGSIIIFVFSIARLSVATTLAFGRNCAHGKSVG